MDDGRPLHERVAALERAVTDGHADAGLPDAARVDDRLDDLEATVEDLDDRVAELDAAVQALRGFAGGVRAIDETIERRADAAVAGVERLEAELEAVRERIDENATPVGASRDGDADRRDDTRAETHLSEHGERTVVERTGVVGNREREREQGETDVRNRCDRSLHGDVAARTDAALADAAAVSNEEDGAERGSADRSLAERLRRLL